MPRAKPTEIDHIDPRWAEGRDYQLVCGLDCPLNYREEDWRVNTAKSNRFLPWRWVRNEVGVVPEERGDLALFLVGADIEKDTPGEWVLLEFLGDEWVAATKDTCGSSAKKKGVSRPELVLKQWETLRENPEILLQRNRAISATSKARNSIRVAHDAQLEWRKRNPEEYRASKKLASLESKKYRYRCTVTGHISTAGGLTVYQKARGIDPFNRVRLDDNGNPITNENQ